MTYSYLVLPGGYVMSYMNNTAGVEFVATPSPMFQIGLVGATTSIIETLTDPGPTVPACVPPDGGMRAMSSFTIGALSRFPSPRPPCSVRTYTPDWSSAGAATPCPARRIATAEIAPQNLATSAFERPTAST